MKSYNAILFLGLILSLAQACKSDTSSQAKATTDNNPSAAAPSAAPVGDEIKPFEGLWYYEAPVTKDYDRKEDYKGRWVNFKLDGTFESGKWQSKTNTGRYTYDTKSEIITLDYSDPKDPTWDWRVKFGPDYMIWIGNANINQTPDQIRMKRVDEYPTPPASEE